MTFDHHTQLIRATNRVAGAVALAEDATRPSRQVEAHVSCLAMSPTPGMQRVRVRVHANKVEWSRLVCTIKWHVGGR